MHADLLIKDIQELITCDLGLDRPHCGSEMDQLHLIENGALAIQGEKILFVGTTSEALQKIKATETYSAKGKVVLPGFVDSHTHPVFHGSREQEFELRTQGASYVDIAKAGGGIRNSVRRLRKASEEELYESARRRLDRLLSFGTTTIEAKSGYGLSLEDEEKMLRVIQTLQQKHPLDILPTFLGAHEFPDEYQQDREGYIRLLMEEMLPRIAQQGLAQFCDIFCEDHVFSVEQSRRILQRAKDLGFQLKLHADEIVNSGGAELAAELGAISADHLVAISPQGIDALAAKKVIATLLPGTTFYLGSDRYAPAQALIQKGVPIAIATDLNPGSSMTESMPMILTLACLKLHLTCAQAISAATINGAHALGIAERVGSLKIGKQADFVLWDAPNYRYIPYHFAVNLVHRVYKKGKLVSPQP
jgi:imidazolonepropionase